MPLQLRLCPTSIGQVLSSLYFFFGQTLLPSISLSFVFHLRSIKVIIWRPSSFLQCVVSKIWLDVWLKWTLLQHSLLIVRIICLLKSFISHLFGLNILMKSVKNLACFRFSFSKSLSRPHFLSPLVFLLNNVFSRGKCRVVNQLLNVFSESSRPA